MQVHWKHCMRTPSGYTVNCTWYTNGWCVLTWVMCLVHLIRHNSALHIPTCFRSEILLWSQAFQTKKSQHVLWFSSYRPWRAYPSVLRVLQTGSVCLSLLYSPWLSFYVPDTLCWLPSWVMMQVAMLSSQVLCEERSVWLHRALPVSNHHHFLDLIFLRCLWRLSWLAMMRV